VKAERERPKPREALERTEDARLGDIALDPRSDGDRDSGERERGDDRERQEQRVVGRMP
jgi:hypothetical protein